MADAPILIDKAKCVGCGKCVGGCGFGALKLVEAPGANKLGRLAEVDPSACRACSACVKACPFKAISEVKAEVVGTEGIDGYRDVWVFAEQNGGRIAEVVFELLGKGLELKAQRGDGCRLCAVLLGRGITAEMTGALSAAGADVVYAVDDPKLAEYEANVYVDAVSKLIFKYKPEVVLAGATAIGRAFFARVAVKVRTGLTADCTALKVEETKNKDTGAMQMLLHQTRPAFGGNIMATIMTPNHRPQMATVRPKVFKRKPAAASGVAEVVREVMDLIAPRTRLAQASRDPDAVDIAAAEVLVSGGRGLKSAAAFGQLEELAKLLGGEVAASRAAVDAGWVPQCRQVGQTGKAVAPKLYMCFGISGAIQHLEGIRGADRIIAVNSDPDAPIFGIADIGIVGDALEIIPALVAELKKGRA
jgi:electron transfer flavoprotein alpha subunit